MRKAWHLFIGDLKRLGGSMVALVTVVGLVVLPSIFSWYNILACWDVFGNTGNLTVAVANSDEGYESDLMPLQVNIGDQVISALRANDQLDWVFTDEEDAIDGTRAGRYYAAVVIPASFSRDMMSFYTDEVEHAKITYYSNQKKSAIAPKVTDQGADQVSTQVNKVFAETVSEIALGVSSALLDYADESGIEGRLGDVGEHVSRLSEQIDDAGGMLGAYSAVLGSAESLVSGSAELLAQSRSAASEASVSVQEMKEALGQAAVALGQSSEVLKAATAELSEDYADAADALDASFAAAHDSAQEAIALLERRAEAAELIGLDLQARMLREAAGKLGEADAATQSAHDGARAHALAASDGLASAKAGYESTVAPALDELTSEAQQASALVSRVAGTLDGTTSDIIGQAGSLSQQIAAMRTKLDDAASALGQTSIKLDALKASATSALAEGDADRLRELIGTDPDVLAAELAAPVALERTAVFPVENFGSAMSPLYTTLALWIGSLLLMVTLKTHPSTRTLSEIGEATPREMFLGRFFTIAFLSLAQSTVLSVGNLVFLGVQAAHPVLYVTCFWVSGLVFAFIIYTLVWLFANLGKALSVVLLIVQVAGGGGSFPLQLLPAFFQNMSPFLPITHAVRAMRAAMFGVWMGDFWIELGFLALFTVPIAIMVLVLHKPLGHIVPKFIARVEKSKLM